MSVTRLRERRCRRRGRRVSALLPSPSRIQEVAVLAAVRSATLVGVDGQPVTVEVHVSSGLPAYQVVGLPDAAVRESRERVRAAVLSSGLECPQRRITVNLAPGGVRKTGSGLELAVALGVLGAHDVLPAGVLDGVAVLGELGLDGSVRPVPGALALVDALARTGVTTVVVPLANASEADLVGDVRVRAARTLGELRACLKGEEPWPDWDPPATPMESTGAVGVLDDEVVDLADVRGLPFAREALEAAAAGGHHLLFCGPPGTGKTMLARRIGTILPPLSHAEALEVTRIHSAAGAPLGGQLVRQRPFRAPHHTASTAALVGGGSGRARPGEITLAHHGTLFLDELGEFAPTALDGLRQPLEERAVRISRQGTSLTFPAAFQLVACSNPCPCGSGGNACRCSDAQRERYRRRLSAPLLDRFDLRVRVDAPDADDVAGASSAEVAARVAAAYERQRARYADWPWSQNAHVAAGALARLLPLRREAEEVWRDLIAGRQLTGRGATRVRRVARTLADLDDRADITGAHVETAAGMRGDVP
jgi:magnesium chelatase family protein